MIRCSPFFLPSALHILSVVSHEHITPTPSFFPFGKRFWLSDPPHPDRRSDRWIPQPSVRAKAPPGCRQESFSLVSDSVPRGGSGSLLSPPLLHRTKTGNGRCLFVRVPLSFTCSLLLSLFYWPTDPIFSAFSSAHHDSLNNPSMVLIPPFVLLPPFPLRINCREPVPVLRLVG